MIGTGPACSRHLLPQGLAGAEDPDSRVVARDACFLCVVLDRHAVDLDPAQRGGVFRLERIGELPDARADHPSQILVRRIEGLAVGDPAVVTAFRHGGATVVIGDGVAQDPIEPADSSVADGVELLDPADERVLQDVLGQRAIADPLLDERQERPVVGDQGRDDLLRGRRERIGRGLFHR